MKIVSIEPTPSPNSMKLNLDEKLPDGSRLSFSAKDQADHAPDYAKKLLQIPGVTGLFQTADFIALDRHPKGDWESILFAARGILGETERPAQQGAQAAAGDAAHPQAAAGWGEVTVRVQFFRGIPMQVRVQAGSEEQRAALPERFGKAAILAGQAAPNLIKERQLVDQGVRYGELADVLAEIVREFDAAYDDERLAALIEQSAQAGEGEIPAEEAAGQLELAASFTEADWRKRYAVLQRLKPSMETLPYLAKALEDPQMSIRRLATVYLGDIKEPEVLPHLLHALRDASPAVRRTAGDTLSDLGMNDPDVLAAISDALKDSNKLVRWRAARFLYEAGDETVVQALQEAQDDSEFEVRLQVKIALERIEGGETAAGSVWQQMTNRARD